jgi:hypothetical protein
MNGLPTTTDVSFFAGQRLIQGCFGQNDLILNFDETEHISIVVTSSIGCIDSGGVSRRVVDFKTEAPFLLDLLGIPVLSAEVRPAGTLRVYFEGGSQIEIYDDSDQFESYVISHSGERIVV